jgi:pimeloyl-ACP methyl ester carboxylesterase
LNEAFRSNILEERNLPSHAERCIRDDEQCRASNLPPRNPRRHHAAAYWLTNTIGSSIRRYYADAHTQDAPAEPTTAPTGVAIFAEDFQSVRRFADRDHANIVSWNRYDRGSHFSPHDAPDLLLEDIRAFFRTLR